MLTKNMTEIQKQKLFSGMKRNNPDLVELIKSDDVQKILRDKELDCSLYFSREEIKEILK